MCHDPALLTQPSLAREWQLCSRYIYLLGSRIPQPGWPRHTAGPPAVRGTEGTGRATREAAAAARLPTALLSFARAFDTPQLPVGAELGAGCPSTPPRSRSSLAHSLPWYPIMRKKTPKPRFSFAFPAAEKPV